MTDEQLADLKREIRISLRALAISVTASNLLSGWVPDQGNIPSIQNERVLDAVYLARALVYDAEGTSALKECQ